MNSFASAGSVLGSRYVLDHQVAVGGMGQVWKATDQVLDRAVAVKLVRPDLIDSEDFSVRFRAEARLAAGLSHPGIAHVYDYAEEDHDGQRIGLLVMELVDGQPLSDQLVAEQLARRDVPDFRRIVSILAQAAEALGAAHKLGIVHRDVKPGNLLITPDGRVKVTDFGIARAVDTEDITEFGQVIGTARYMSPEQARGEVVTPASDVYSLAVVGYEMLSGRTPFAGESPVAIALAHVQTAPPALPLSVPLQLRSLIARSLAKLPEQRPRDGAAFAFALQRIAIDPTPATAVFPVSGLPAPTGAVLPRQPNRPRDLQPTAVFQHPATHMEGLADPDTGGTDLVPAGAVRSVAPLLADGWINAQRRRRRVAGWGAAIALAACVLFLIAFNRGADDDPATAASSPSESTVPAAPAAVAAADVVTIDLAVYLGRPEAEARATLSAAGLTPVSTTAASTADLTGMVIDVQPRGPIARGSNVTITVGDGTVGDGTVTAVTDPPADDGQGNGNGKGKGKGKSRD